MRMRLKDIRLLNNAIEFDLTHIDEPDSENPPPPVAGENLPDGYDSDTDVAFGMLVNAMDDHGLTPIGVQGHGDVICAALNDTWNGLNTYPHPQTDAVMWPDFGSIDVTVDSGKGGWQFRPDGHDRYDERYYRQLHGLDRL
jgi:hypothetical protein